LLEVRGAPVGPERDVTPLRPAIPLLVDQGEDGPVVIPPLHEGVEPLEGEDPEATAAFDRVELEHGIGPIDLQGGHRAEVLGLLIDAGDLL
jgi:hypothetical protein